MIKIPKKVSTFRLSEETKEQIKLMSDYDEYSEARIIEVAVNDFYVRKYYREMPDKFPASKKNWLVL
jgi:predicted transcriptional regulator